MPEGRRVAAAMASRWARAVETGTGAGAPTVLAPGPAVLAAAPGPTLAAGATGAAGGGVGGGPSGTGGAGAAPVVGGGAAGAWPVGALAPAADGVWVGGGEDGGSAIGARLEGWTAGAAAAGADCGGGIGACATALAADSAMVRWRSASCACAGTVAAGLAVLGGLGADGVDGADGAGEPPLDMGLTGALMRGGAGAAGVPGAPGIPGIAGDGRVSRTGGSPTTSSPPILPRSEVTRPGASTGGEPGAGTSTASLPPTSLIPLSAGNGAPGAVGIPGGGL